MKYAPRKVYIKKDGDYVELSYTDFCHRRQADQSYMDKLFIPVQGCLLEVVREQYVDFYREKERWRYLQKLDTNHKLLSLEGFTDSEGNVIDFVIDEAMDVAETVVHTVMVDRLKAALPLLSGGGQAYTCNNYGRYGNVMCTAHAIEARDLFNAVLADINRFADMAVNDERAVRAIEKRLTETDQS